ncbi:MAG: SDR family oxidoreductase, partial [Caulobacterales bacterium]|nr:SDR family oxidoreductase [Caulobacterales bacterium]
MTQRRLCLVTGASAGIGAALAREYAARGWDVALTARRAELLRELQTDIESAHDVKALVFPADLAEPGAPARLLEQIAHAGRQVDGLVNNAGYGLPGGFVSNSWADHDRFIRLMLTAPTELCHLVLPGMAERGFGRILNIASLAGLLPAGAGHTLYAGVKSYWVHTSEALNAEMRGRGVNVTAICPGFTDTEFHYVNQTRQQVESAFPRFMWSSAE